MMFVMQTYTLLRHGAYSSPEIYPRKALGIFVPPTAGSFYEISRARCVVILIPEIDALLGV